MDHQGTPGVVAGFGGGQTCGPPPRVRTGMPPLQVIAERFALDAVRIRYGAVGVGVFSDWGMVWDHGQSVASAPVFSGIGGTLWLAMSPLGVNLAVARGRRAGMRIRPVAA